MHSFLTTEVGVIVNCIICVAKALIFSVLTPFVMMLFPKACIVFTENWSGILKLLLPALVVEVEALASACMKIYHHAVREFVYQNSCHLFSRIAISWGWPHRKLRIAVVKGMLLLCPVIFHFTVTILLYLASTVTAWYFEFQPTCINKAHKTTVIISRSRQQTWPTVYALYMQDIARSKSAGLWDNSTHSLPIKYQ